MRCNYGLSARGRRGEKVGWKLEGKRTHCARARARQKGWLAAAFILRAFYNGRVYTRARMRVWRARTCSFIVTRFIVYNVNTFRFFIYIFRRARRARLSPREIKTARTGIGLTP